MADKITSTNILAIGYEYTDSETQKPKTVYLKVPNPKVGLTETQIKTAAQKLISGDNPILKPPADKSELPFDSNTAVVTAYTETVETTELDLGLEE